jgi:60 kDa SS-A/Ro ribonucleoprotein
MGDTHLREHGGSRTTPQSEPMAPGQVENPAGGYVWWIDEWGLAQRFLVLGTEGGSYYVGQREFTRQAAGGVERCLNSDGPRLVALIREISEGGRAAKNDPALFALAMATADANQDTRKLAWEALPAVARTGTHLLHFCAYMEMFRGWGPAARRGVGSWYAEKDPADLAYQLIKYRQRDGWTHRDVLRLAHPNPHTPTHGNLYRWVTQGDVPDPQQKLIEGFVKAQAAASAKETAALVLEYGLPREALNTEHLRSPEVWEALLGSMPLTAMIRNLANLTRAGVLKPLSDAEKHVIVQLGDKDRLRKARVHPITILSAASVYARGYSELGKGEPWVPVSGVVEALSAAFYDAFETVRPAGKRTLLAFDVSGSMSQVVNGTPGLTARDASAAMGLVTAATEPYVAGMAFTSNPVPFPITGTERLDDVVRTMHSTDFGRTDCAVPMQYATREGLTVDTFVIYTDNETWAGGEHPAQALRKYREQFEVQARLIVVGTSATEFSIADPNDRGMLDVVGFDTAAPALMSDFSRGDL